MAESRHDFNQEVIRRLGECVGLHCSNPECDVATKGAHSTDAKAVSIGVASHIHAASKGGPRYDANQTEEQRRSFENGIWLCASCGTVVDRDEYRFPPELLREWKRAAQSRAADRIGKAQALRQPDNSGQLRALAHEFEVLVERAHGYMLTPTPTARYDFESIRALLPNVPELLADKRVNDSLKTIRHWLADPGERDAARMIYREAKAIIEAISKRVG